MKYQQPAFSLPVCNKPMTDLEYALRVGNITQAEYDRLKKRKTNDNQ